MTEKCLFQRAIMTCVSGRSLPVSRFTSVSQKCFLDQMGFLLQYFEWPLEITHRTTILPVQYPVLIMHPFL